MRRAGGRRYSPVVMRIAAEHDVDLEQVEGTGRGGRVRKQDVLAYVESGAARKSRRCTSRARTGPTSRSRPRQRRPRLQPRRRGRRKAAAPAAARRVATGAGQPLSRMRQAIGSRMVQSLQTAATCTTIAEADMSRIEAARQAVRAQLPALPGAGGDRDAAGVPGAQRHARGRHPHAPRGRAPRHRRLARRGRPDRPGHPRRAGPERRGPGQAHQGHRQARPHEPAHAGRGQRRHVHDHQPRRLRLADGHPGDQPAAGGDPRHRGRRQAPGGGHRRARQRLDRDPRT